MLIFHRISYLELGQFDHTNRMITFISDHIKQLTLQCMNYFLWIERHYTSFSVKEAKEFYLECDTWQTW